MFVYRISKCRFIEDMSGTGASLYAGRWHNVGTHLLYTSESKTLALLENVVNNALMPYIKYCCIGLEIPDKSIIDADIKKLPKNWQQYPAPESLKKIGDHFIKEQKAIALKVPSALLNNQWNYLLNPAHKDFKKIKLVEREEISFDKRLIK